MVRFCGGGQADASLCHGICVVVVVVVVVVALLLDRMTAIYLQQK